MTQKRSHPAAKKDLCMGLCLRVETLRPVDKPTRYRRSKPLAYLSDQVELSEREVVHLLVVCVWFVAVGSCGGGIGAGTPALAAPAADALIAALVTRKLSEIINTSLNSRAAIPGPTPRTIGKA